jgi:hypothetical protein
MSEDVILILEHVDQSLREWIKESIQTLGAAPQAHKIAGKAADVHYGVFLRGLNTSIVNIRHRLHDAYDALKELEATHPGSFEQLTPKYLQGHIDLRDRLKEVAKMVSAIAKLYFDKLEEAKATTPNYRKYLVEKNEKALDMLWTLKFEDLLKMLADAELLGL